MPGSWRRKRRGQAKQLAFVPDNPRYSYNSLQAGPRIEPRVITLLTTSVSEVFSKVIRFAAR